jgi:hypothetical protein
MTSIPASLPARDHNPGEAGAEAQKKGKAP